MPHRIQYTAISTDLIAGLYRNAAQWASDWKERVDEWESPDLGDVSEAQAKEAIALRDLVQGLGRDRLSRRNPAAPRTPTSSGGSQPASGTETSAADSLA